MPLELDSMSLELEPFPLRWIPCQCVLKLEPVSLVAEPMPLELEPIPLLELEPIPLKADARATAAGTHASGAGNDAP